MFRTRDYAVMLGLIAFLVVGISTTAVRTFVFPGGAMQGAAIFSALPEGEPTYTATVAEDNDVSREERVAALKKKIAGKDFFALAETTPEVEPEVPEVPAATTDEKVKENRCVSYHAAATAWTPSGIKFEEVEGARLVYKEVAAPPVSASSTVVTPATNRNILLQLPVRSVPLASQTCIGTDVIGIATDGSLIRNNEIGLYSVFGSETMIGYALDGFPIYGLSATQTDICGGVMVQGQYRYQLTAERDAILNCYAGAPVSL